MSLKRQLLLVAVWVALLVAAARFLEWRRFEFRSAAEVGGWPWVHIVIDFDSHSTSRAEGVLAIADRAAGVIAIGALATGVVAVGAIAVGLVSVGAIAVGPLAALGAVALGFFALGALAGGGLASGAVALGFGALGPIAIGRFSAGVIPIGRYRWGLETCDPEARRFFERYPHWLLRSLPAQALGGDEDVG